MDPGIAIKTKETLGSIIKKPPLTEKLLGKPPFRFLHDILTELIKHTGFFDGLYSPEELNSDNVKDKGSKVAFLQKAIDVVAFTVGQQVNCRPSKVVAGHEPERTNEFLQLLAAAIIDKRDCSEAVKRVLGGEKPTSGALSAVKKGGSTSLKAEDPKSQSRSHSRERDKADKKNAKEASNGRDKGKRNEENGDVGKDKRKDRSRERETQRDRGRDEKAKNKVKKSEEGLKDGPVENGHVDMNGPVESDSQVMPQRIPRPTSAKGPRTRTTDGLGGEGLQGGIIQVSGDDLALVPATEYVADERPVARAASGRVRRPQHQTQVNREDTANNGLTSVDDQQPEGPPIAVQRQARPSSARPAPPRVKRSEPSEDPNVRVNSGRDRGVVAPVIVEDSGHDEEEENAFIVEEAQPDVTMAAVPNHSTDEDVRPGALVKTLEATQKKLEAASEQHKDEQNIISDTHRRKERERVQKEIDKLLGSIQGLTSSAHPLGRTMDYVQEDIDAMQKELAMWQKESAQHAAALRREQEVTEREVEPLRRELEELEAQIKDQVELVSEVKSRIVQNDDRIQKMLSGVLFKS